MKFKIFCLRALVLFAALGLFLNAGEFKSVTDMAGNEVKVPAKVDKIAALWPANTQILLILNAADKIVATSEHITKNAWLVRVFPPIVDVKTKFSGNSVNIEELFAANPDVVIVSNKNLRDSLAKNGFNALFAGFGDYEGMQKSVLMSARIIGGEAEQRAREFNAYLAQNIDKVAARTKDLAHEKRPKVLHIVSGADLLKIDGTNNMINTWIELAGGTNAIKKEGIMLEITAEEVIAANPDIIIAGNSKADEVLAKIYAEPRFSGLNAVKNKRVYANPSGFFSWDRYGAEAALQILWAAKTIQPEIFADIDVRAETKAFYKKFMNYELSDAEFEHILKGLSPNGE